MGSFPQWKVVKGMSGKPKALWKAMILALGVLMILGIAFVVCAMLSLCGLFPDVESSVVFAVGGGIICGLMIAVLCLLVVCLLS